MITRGYGYTSGTVGTQKRQGLRCWQSTCRRNSKESHFEGVPSCHLSSTFSGFLSALISSAFPWGCVSFVFYPPAASTPILFYPPLTTFLFTTCLPSSTAPVFIPPDPVTSSLIPHKCLVLTCFSPVFRQLSVCTYSFYTPDPFVPRLKIFMSLIFNCAPAAVLPVPFSCRP